MWSMDIYGVCDEIGRRSSKHLAWAETKKTQNLDKYCYIMIVKSKKNTLSHHVHQKACLAHVKPLVDCSNGGTFHLAALSWRFLARPRLLSMLCTLVGLGTFSSAVSLLPTYRGPFCWLVNNCSWSSHVNPSTVDWANLTCSHHQWPIRQYQIIVIYIW